MSVVSGITLICSLAEGSGDGRDVEEFLARAADEAAGYPLLQKFVEVSELFGGCKHPQCLVFGAGLNHFSSSEDAFADRVFAREWESPENVVLIIQPEDGPTRVWRR